MSVSGFGFDFVSMFCSGYVYTCDLDYMRVMLVCFAEIAWVVAGNDLYNTAVG